MDTAQDKVQDKVQDKSRKYEDYDIWHIDENALHQFHLPQSIVKYLNNETIHNYEKTEQVVIIKNVPKFKVECFNEPNTFGEVKIGMMGHTLKLPSDGNFTVEFIDNGPTYKEDIKYLFHALKIFFLKTQVKINRQTINNKEER